MIFNNPEFKKNLKLELSKTRALVPLLIFLLLLLITTQMPDSKYYADTYPTNYLLGERIYGWFCAFGFFYTIFWGTQLVAQSFAQEVNQRTWDFVRISSISPAKIFFGKIFGPSIVVWLITLLGIIPMLILSAKLRIPENLPALAQSENLSVIFLTLSLIAWVLFSYSTVSLIYLHGRLSGAAQNVGGAITIMLLLNFKLGSLIAFSFNEFCSIIKVYKDQDGVPSYGANTILIDNDLYMRTPGLVTWYGLETYVFNLSTLILLFFAIWSMIACYRLLKLTLQESLNPWAWFIFLISSLAILQGFYTDDSDLLYLASMYYLFVLLILTLIYESGDILKANAFFDQLSIGNYRDALYCSPLWARTLVISVFLIIFIFFTNPSYVMIVLWVSTIGLIARDIFAMHCLANTKRIRSPFLANTIYLIICYILLPVFFKICLPPGSETNNVFLPQVETKSTNIVFWPLIFLQIGAWFFLWKMTRAKIIEKI